MGSPCGFFNVFHIKQRGQAGSAAIKVGLDADIYSATPFPTAPSTSPLNTKKAGRPARARTLCTLRVCTVYDGVRTQSRVSQRVCQRRCNFDASSSPSAVEASTLITFCWERTRATFASVASVKTKGEKSEAVVFLSIYLVFFVLFQALAQNGPIMCVWRDSSRSSPPSASTSLQRWPQPIICLHPAL